MAFDPAPRRRRAGAALVAAGVAGYALRGESDEATYQAEATRAAQGAEAELVVEGDYGTLDREGHAQAAPRRGVPGLDPG